MSKTVVILPPYQRCDEDVDRWHRRAPVNLLLRLLEPLGVLVEHRIDNVYEGFVSGEEAVAASKNVAFKPALEGVLAEHLHDAARDVEFAATGILRLVLREPCLFRSRIDRREPVRGGFIGAEDTEGSHIAAHYFRKKVSKHVGRRSIGAAGRLQFDGIVAKVRHIQFLA